MNFDHTTHSPGFSGSGTCDQLSREPLPIQRTALVKCAPLKWASPFSTRTTVSKTARITVTGALSKKSPARAANGYSGQFSIWPKTTEVFDADRQAFAQLALFALHRSIPARLTDAAQVHLIERAPIVAGQTVSLDAMHTQHKTVAQLLYAKGADYLLPLKGNQEGLLESAQQLLPESLPPRS